jgi:hypothetical protein
MKARLCIILDCDDGTSVVLSLAESRKLAPRLAELLDSVWEDEPDAEPEAKEGYDELRGGA